MKLTEEQIQLVISVLDDMYGEGKIFKKDTKKWEEFKAFLLKDDEASEIEALIDICKEYNKSRATKENSFAVSIAFVIMYDMWINKSPVWPVLYNPEWENNKKG